MTITSNLRHDDVDNGGLFTNKGLSNCISRLCLQSKVHYCDNAYVDGAAHAKNFVLSAIIDFWNVGAFRNICKEK